MNNTTVKSANNFFTQFATSAFYTESQHNSTLFIQNINGLFDETKPIESVFDGFIYFSKRFYKHTAANTFQNVSPYLNKGCLLFWSNGNDHLIAFASNNYDAAQDTFDLLFFTNTIGVNILHERKSINLNSILSIDTATISANFSGGTLPLLGIVETDYKQPKGFYIGGDLEQAKKDIISLIHKDKRLTPTPINTVSAPPTTAVSDSKIRISFVTISESTKILRVMLTNAEQHKENSIGAKLLLNLTTAKERYLYQVADKSRKGKNFLKPLTESQFNGISNDSTMRPALNDSDLGQSVSIEGLGLVQITAELYASTLNQEEDITVIAETGNIKIKTPIAHKILTNRLMATGEKLFALDVDPVDLNFDGIVTIHPSVCLISPYLRDIKLPPPAPQNKTFKKKIFKIIPRVDIVFHELWENWERTTNKEAYGWTYLLNDWATIRELNKKNNPKKTLFRTGNNSDFKVADRPNALYNNLFIGAHQKSKNAVPTTDLAIKTALDINNKYTTFSNPSKASSIIYYEQIVANTWDRNSESKTTTETYSDTLEKNIPYEYAY